ncbi:MAG: hypothetical protein N3A69_12420 [Leptospiraceae bacterium]|nr:hypothetical protein [Leptospiraceae bacterium]
MKFISVFFLTLLLGFNLYLYNATKKKIFLYNEIPPFIWLDYTNSEWKNPNSKLKYLFDKNLTTSWRKERESPKDWDLELELRLTHTFQNGVYFPKQFQFLKLFPCTPGFWKWEVFLNEAINVDKVLRLPESKTIASSNFELLETEKKILIPELNLKPTADFDENLFILGIRLKARELGTCLSEIELSNKL